MLNKLYIIYSIVSETTHYLGIEGSDTVYTADSTFRTTFIKNLDELESLEEENTEETVEEAANEAEENTKASVE